MEALRRDFSTVEIVKADSPEELDRNAGEADILFSWAIGDALMARAGRLAWLHSPAAGVGSYLTPSFLARNVPFTNSRGVHAIPIAEHVMGLLTGLARGLRHAVVEQTTTGMRRESWWDRVPEELFGKTLGLYGYGAIGREVARRAASFGMRVVALRRRAERPPSWDPELLAAIGLPVEEPRVDAVLGPGDLDRLLAESDALVVTAALTKETEGAIDGRALARLRRGAWVVNVARGKIIRQADLVEALRSGHLGGAGLDVFESEPLPAESPLYTLGNVLLTPHVSGLSRGFWPREMRLFRANLTRFLKGRPLLNLVDTSRGY
ncbi:MAG TPA: D-2-hydroxyacid dehydrogenase [Candidatus Eisenbacteria bacterium]|nr:D-2-hydroxyacid dehydrogenase [Candidatus Eisenbacteria bacterium]